MPSPQESSGFLKTNFKDLGNQIIQLWKPFKQSQTQDGSFDSFFFILSAIPFIPSKYLFDKSEILKSKGKDHNNTKFGDASVNDIQTPDTTQNTKKVSAKKIAFLALGCLTFIPALAISIAIAAICAALTAVYAVFQTLNIIRVNALRFNSIAYDKIGQNRLKGHRATLIALAVITLALIAMLVLSMPQVAILPLNPLSLAVAVGAMSILVGLSFFSTKTQGRHHPAIMNDSTKTLFLLLTIAAPLASYGMQLAGLTVAPWAAVLLVVAPAVFVTLGVFGYNMYYYNSLAKAENLNGDSLSEDGKLSKPKSNLFTESLKMTFDSNFTSKQGKTIVNHSEIRDDELTT